MKKYLYLFRHGESEWNQKNIFTGWLDPDLTELGVKQMLDIGIQLKNESVDLAYCSQLLRSKRSLALALQYHVEVPVIIDQRIAERNYGDLSGTSKAEYEKKYGADGLYKIRRAYDYPPPNGESIKMVEERVMPFLDEIISKIKQEKMNVLISAHGNSMRPIRKYFENLTIEAMCALENPWDRYFKYEIETI